MPGGAGIGAVPSHSRTRDFQCGQVLLDKKEREMVELGIFVCDVGVRQPIRRK